MRPGLSRRRLRVTTGCLTCRARRVKCDERRPVCRNCAKKDRRCLYHGRPGGTSTYGLSQGAVQAPSSTNRESRHAETARPLGETESRALDSSPGTRATLHVLSVAEPTEPIYANTTTSEPSVADHGSPIHRIQPLESIHAPNLCAILQHTNFPGSSHPSSPTNSPAQPLLLHHQPFEEPSHHDTIQRTFYVDDPIQLSATEVLIFRNYVERVSKWIDSFSHDQPFYNQVPSLALHCPMLLHACLAVSAKQLSRAPQSTTSLTLDTSPVYYYQQALREMSHFLIEPSYSGSDELLASSIILSTYEILDVSGPSFGSHLKGVASLIRSHRITGDETGIRGATYWTWYRHEVWVAFQTGRRMFLDEGYWKPKDVQEGFEGMSMRDVANRVLFVFGQCVSWYGDLYAGGRDRSRGELGTTPSPSPSTINTGATAMRARQENVERQRARADELRDALEEWKKKLPVSMRIYFRQTQPQTQSQTHSLQSLQENGSTASTGQEINQFPATWYAYPESAISHQLYHASKILLELHTPSFSSSNTNENNPFRTRRDLERSRREIFMIANSRIDQTWGLSSTQCLYVAGLVTEGVLERECTLELIEMCQRVTGRQTVCIADQLRGFWQEEE